MIESVPINSAALLIGPPGVGKFEFCIDAVGEALQKNERLVFVTVDVHPVEIRRWIRRYGASLDEQEGKRFFFVDCYSSSVGREGVEDDYGENVFHVGSLSNIEGIGMSIAKAADELVKPVKVVFYTLSTLFLYNPPQTMAKFFQMISSKIRTDYGFILYVLHQGVHDVRTVNLLESLVDGVIEMRFNNNLQRELRIHHYRGMKTSPEWTRFDVNKFVFMSEVDEKILVNSFLDYEYGKRSTSRQVEPRASHYQPR